MLIHPKSFKFGKFCFLSANLTIILPFQVGQKIYYFLNCQNFRKLRSIHAEKFLNYYYLLMPKIL